MDDTAQKELICIPFVFPGVERVRCAFQTRRAAGQKASADPYAWGNIVMAEGDREERVFANRKTLQEQLGFAHWQECKQVHGDAVVFDPEPAMWDSFGWIEADGLATALPGQALVIKTADCQPLLLAHESGKYVAALHVGWRGNRICFPQSGVTRFCEHYGLRPQELFAVRGPSLGPAASEFVHFDKEWGSDFQSWFISRTKTMDLWRLTRDQLCEAGLERERIFGVDLCTWSLNDHFFSYRRVKASGRQGSFIWMES